MSAFANVFSGEVRTTYDMKHSPHLVYEFGFHNDLLVSSEVVRRDVKRLHVMDQLIKMSRIKGRLACP
jgi:hypothetical protein